MIPLQKNASRNAVIDKVNEIIADMSRNQVTVGEGLAVYRGRNGNHVALLNNNTNRTSNSLSVRFGRIISYLAITNDQWYYKLNQVKLNSQAKLGKLRTGTLFTNSGGGDFHAWNLSEDINITTTGIKGNGVDFTEGSPISETAMSIQPCPIGSIVLCFKLGTHWFFMYENGIDGKCTEEE